MITQNILLRESGHFYRDNNRFLISLAHRPDNILIPVTESQARTLVTAAAEQEQIVSHQPSLLGSSSCRFQADNELTAVMNEAGTSDCLLSLVPYDQNHRLAGEGDRCHTLPDSGSAELAERLAHRILSSAARLSSPNVRSQSGRTQPTLLAHGHGRYLFSRPKPFAACLRPQTETQTDGRGDGGPASAAAGRCLAERGSWLRGGEDERLTGGRTEDG